MATLPAPMPPPTLVRAADHAPAAGGSWSFSHPFNPAPQIDSVAQSRMTGLERTGVNLARVPPGQEAFAYHSYATEEEWIYILSGRGIAEIDGAEHEVGPGDFMGFPTPSVAHHLRNPFDVGLVYLVGGERRSAEISDFPRLGERMVRVGDTIAIHELGDAVEFPSVPKLEPAR